MKTQYEYNREYIIPSMQEVKNLAQQKNFTVLSTFSGGGGASLGLKQAGADILGMNEFVPKARETYAANFPVEESGTVIFDDDVRELTGQMIMDKLNLKVGELDMLEGSPPCSAFSLAGKRKEGWGVAKKYSDGKVQVVDDLFFEYIRLLGELQPKTFIAENVQGLTIGVAKAYRDEILNGTSPDDIALGLPKRVGMREHGYVVQFKVLNAADYGVAQTRRRVIFIGIRKDIWNKLSNLNEYEESIWPPKSHNQDAWMTLGEAFKTLPPKEQMTGWKMLNKDTKSYNLWNNTEKGDTFSVAHQRIYGSGSWFSHIRFHENKPASTLTTSYSGFLHPDEPRNISVEEYTRLMSVPDDFINLGTTKQRCERIGRMVAPSMYKALGDHLNDIIYKPLKALDKIQADKIQIDEIQVDEIQVDENPLDKYDALLD